MSKLHSRCQDNPSIPECCMKQGLDFADRDQDVNCVKCAWFMQKRGVQAAVDASQSKPGRKKRVRLSGASSGDGVTS